ncbi:MAG: helix-turn-helix domain-containing protein, partial [Thermodesulfobacteriota bacterium]
EIRRLTRSIKYEDVIAAVAKRFGISEQQIREAGRRNNVARKICLYLLRRLTDKSNEEIGGYFGIGYTAVSQATSRLKREMKENRKLKKVVQDMEIELLSEE